MAVCTNGSTTTDQSCQYMKLHFSVIVRPINFKLKIFSFYMTNSSKHMIAVRHQKENLSVSSFLTSHWAKIGKKKNFPVDMIEVSMQLCFGIDMQDCYHGVHQCKYHAIVYPPWTMKSNWNLNSPNTWQDYQLIMVNCISSFRRGGFRPTKVSPYWCTVPL